MKQRFGTNEPQERPQSGGSNTTKMTGGLTGGFTQVSGKMSSNTAQLKGQAELEEALEKLGN